MSFTQDHHLDYEALTAFANGRLDGPAFDHAEAHVMECEACCKQLRSIDVSIAITRFAFESRSVGSSSNHGRFVPGQLLESRYRIVSLLGIGGMGEVYRADDLKLNQTVALKFLDKTLSEHPAAFERLHREVSIARGIAHPNVCRVYDVAEVDGQPFLSMEYIDGEDLRTLLQRIGRLPRNKGFELSKQLCLGLNAAHQRGVLHRDLKPANIMIDGRGQLRITDFGLATLTASTSSEVVGTPAYMSPEQISRGESTVRSDIYSLGLVLAEMFTGERVVPGTTLAEVKRFQETSVPPTLSHDIEPEMEHVVRQCLAKEPSERPASVAEILSVLPSSDPLAQMLASGETPSPELLASRLTQTNPVSTIAANSCLAVLLCGLAVLLLAPFGRLGGLIHTVDFPLEPAILAHKARAIVIASGRFGDFQPVWPSEADGFMTNYHFQPGTRAASARKHDAYHYWYRTHYVPMVAERRLETRVSFDDPAPFWPGMTVLRLDLAGRLIDFHATPHANEPTLEDRFEFENFFTREVIGMDFADFEPMADSWTPQTAFDHLETWKQKGIPIDKSMKIFAATYRGRLVACRIMWPGSDQNVVEPEQSIEYINRIAIVLLIGLGCILARHNVRRGRSDRLGAARLAWFTAGLTLLGWIFGATITGSLNSDTKTLITGMQSAVFTGAVMWCFYLALEPFVRRFWPTTLITWTRFLRGQFRNQQLGRDMLVGLTAGVFCHVVTKVWFVSVEAVGFTPRPLIGVTPDVLLGMRESLGGLVDCGLYALTDSMFLLMFLFAVRLPIRVKGIATVLFALFFSLQFTLLSPEYAAIHVLFWTMVAILLTRFGLVALVCFQFVRHAVEEFPLPADMSKWYSGYALIPFSMIAILGLYAYCITSVPRKTNSA